MTIVIGALCGFPNDIQVIGVADHMVTSGDVEFEQPQPKMWKLGDHVVAMFFGLSAAQAEIASFTEVAVHHHGLTKVNAIANSYAWHSRDYVRRQAEADLLAPLGLSLADVSKSPSVIDRGLARQLSKQLQNYYDGSGLADDLGGAIIIGTDDDGAAHLYRVEHGKAMFLDGLGFAAAGGGQWHAESQFMFSRYTRGWAFADALSLIYSAKKRAEVAPGVGKIETDLVLVTTKPRNVIHVKNDNPFLIGIDAIYKEHQKTFEAGIRSQHHAVKLFVDDFFQKANAEAAKQQANDSQPEVLPTTPEPEVAPKPSSKKKPKAAEGQ